MKVKELQAKIKKLEQKLTAQNTEDTEVMGIAERINASIIKHWGGLPGDGARRGRGGDSNG